MLITALNELSGMASNGRLNFSQAIVLMFFFFVETEQEQHKSNKKKKKKRWNHDKLNERNSIELRVDFTDEILFGL